MSTRVLAPQASRVRGESGRLKPGGHYRLPSGAVVRFERILRGGEAACRYVSLSDGSRVTQADEVSFDCGWLQRNGLLNWGG